MREFEIVSTGSKGNCIIIDDSIMLDCGVPFTKIKNKLSKIKIIFISHIHNDHFKKSTIQRIAFDKPNIKFLVGHYLVKDLLDCGVEKKNILVLDIEKWYDIGMFKVRFDYLTHDVPNNCIHIEFPNGYKLLYATDTSNMDNVVAENYHWYFVEANYETDEEIREKIKEAREKGEYCYLERVQHTHLSQLQALNWLNKNKGVDSQFQFIHQHEDKEENNE